MKLFKGFVMLLAFAIGCLEVNNVNATLKKDGSSLAKKYDQRRGWWRRIVNALQIKTREDVLYRKGILQGRINYLADNQHRLTVSSIIAKLSGRYGSNRKSYLAHLINSIEWLNKKLKKFNEPVMDRQELAILKEALVKMVNN